MPTGLTPQQADRRVLAAIAALDEESWLGLIVTRVRPWTETAGGYRDKTGIAALQRAIEDRIAVTLSQP